MGAATAGAGATVGWHLPQQLFFPSVSIEMIKNDELNMLVKGLPINAEKILEAVQVIHDEGHEKEKGPKCWNILIATIPSISIASSDKNQLGILSRIAWYCIQAIVCTERSLAVKPLDLEKLVCNLATRLLDCENVITNLAAAAIVLIRL